MSPKSLTGRVTLAAVAAVGGALLVAGLAVIIFTARSDQAQLDRDLTRLSRQVDRRAGDEPEQREEFQATLTVGDLIVDPSARTVKRGGRELECTRREFELIEVFARNPGIVLERQRLLELVWGYDWVADTNVVDVFVSYLRRKLEENDEPRMIETVRGIGFVLRDPAAAGAK